MYKYKSLQAVQLPREHLSFLQNLLNFIIKKYLKQEVDDDDDLSVCVDERSSCSLLITEDIKIYQCQMIKRQWCYYTQWRIALLTSIKELFLLPKFDNSNPLS